jgi:protein subunit release factor A
MFIVNIFSLAGIKYKVCYESKSSIALSIQSIGLLEDHIGKHTVTRVPPTEKGSRRHTSIVSISLLEILEVKLEIQDKDLDISFMGSNCKAGGANANSVNSACRIVHKPTGISVKCDQERDQIQNRKIALRILKSKLMIKATADHDNALYSQKSTQLDGMGRGNRSFTWNLYEGVITNHSNGKQTRKIKEVFKGNLDLLK